MMRHIFHDAGDLREVCCCVHPLTTFTKKLSVPRRVELTEVNPLPSAENRLAIVYSYSHARTHCGCFQMRRAVAFTILHTSLSLPGLALERY